MSFAHLCIGIFFLLAIVLVTYLMNRIINIMCGNDRKMMILVSWIFGVLGFSIFLVTLLSLIGLM